MKSLAIIMIIVSVVAADEKILAKPEKRQSPLYGSDVLQSTQGQQPTPTNTVPASYQPNYVPTCVIQPFYPNPSVPAYQPSFPYYNVPSEPQYIPQYQPQYPAAPYQPQQYPNTYQPQQYPATYQPQQYPIGYQPAQYPATYQPQQYPIAYQPQQQQQSQSVTPYSYSYFVSTANNADKANNNNINSVPVSAKK